MRSFAARSRLPASSRTSTGSCKEPGSRAPSFTACTTTAYAASGRCRDHGSVRPMDPALGDDGAVLEEVKPYTFVAEALDLGGPWVLETHLRRSPDRERYNDGRLIRIRHPEAVAADSTGWSVEHEHVVLGRSTYFFDP